jgi:glycosyltransferase involved in cell wall biosynthesis
MRTGMPCIGGTEDAGAEVIVNGETGICVNPARHDALAGAITTLLTSPALRESYGAKGRERFSQHFTFERFCDRLHPILHDAFA